MIVKSLRHSTPDFEYIVNYLFDGISNRQDFRWVLFQNLSSGVDREAIISEFEENAQYLKTRSNLSRKRIYKYSEIVGFSKESTQHLTKDKLQKIARNYKHLRDPENSALVICVPHFEKGKSIHLHFLFSSNYIMSNKSSDMRMSNASYYKIRRDIERQTLKAFPELHHSTVYLDKKELSQLLPKEILAGRKKLENSPPKSFGKQTKKQKVAETIRSILDKSSSLTDFVNRVNNNEGYKTYSRNSKLKGIIKDSKKYRFKTLGIKLLPENLKVLERLGELENLQRVQEWKLGKEMER